MDRFLAEEAAARAAIRRMTRPQRVFSGRTGYPTQIVPMHNMPHWNIWLASADWAFYPDFLHLIGCTLLWDALDQKCRNRHRVTQARAATLSLYRCEYLNWYFHSGVSGEEPAPPNNMLLCGGARPRYSWRELAGALPHNPGESWVRPFDQIQSELALGGCVVVFCLESKHRSVGSLVAFLIRRLGLSFDAAADVVAQHPQAQLH